MAKFCSNGHQMEDTWSDCPYCQRTGFQRQSAGAGGGTRLDGAVPAIAGTSVENDMSHLPQTVDGVGSRTVLLSTVRKAPVVGWLVALQGSQKGEDFRLRDGQNTVGSGPGADIVLRDPTVSAKHASIRYKDGAFSLTDLDSTNGTFLNEKDDPVARELLKDNDVIRVGEVSLKFKCL